MFTGIVREKGRILQKRDTAEGSTFRFACGDLISQMKVGHSISVDGVCLTVTAVGGNWLEVDATPETLRCSNLGTRRTDDALNLEPALTLHDLLGGHLVQGHVDGTGRIEEIREEGNSWIFRVQASEAVLRYCVHKGSVTLNGVSLTVSALAPSWFEVTIIPHTMAVTNMAELEIGDLVNLEADVVSKYVESHVQRLVGSRNSVGAS
jgi:riboflavin synthase